MDGYLKQVKQIQNKADSSFLNLNDDLKALGAQDDTKLVAIIADLSHKESALKSAQGQAKALNAPAAAAKHQRDVISLYGQAAQVVGDLKAFAAYRLAMDPLESKYEARAKQFDKVVGGATGNGELAADLAGYSQAVGDFLSGAGKVVPPVAAAREHNDYLNNLRNLKAALDETAQGLNLGNADEMAAASRQMKQLQDRSGSDQQQLQSDTAKDIGDFNAKITKMDKIMDLIRGDQAALKKEFDHN